MARHKVYPTDVTDEEWSFAAPYLMLMDEQVRKRPVGFRPRIQSLRSVAKAPNEHWATDMCRVWAGPRWLGDDGAGDRLPQP
jgi:hypothetical protein